MKKELHNNGLHQTGRGGVAVRSMRPVVEARPAGEPGVGQAHVRRAAREAC